MPYGRKWKADPTGIKKKTVIACCEDDEQNLQEWSKPLFPDKRRNWFES